MAKSEKKTSAKEVVKEAAAAPEVKEKRQSVVELTNEEVDLFYSAIKKTIDEQVKAMVKTHYPDSNGGVAVLLEKEYKSKLLYLNSRLAPGNVKRAEKLGNRVNRSSQKAKILRLLDNNI